MTTALPSFSNFNQHRLYESLFLVFRYTDHEGEVWCEASAGAGGDQSAQHAPDDDPNGRPPARLPRHPGHAQRQVPGRRSHPLHRSGHVQLGEQENGEEVSKES